MNEKTEQERVNFEEYVIKTFDGYTDLTRLINGGYMSYITNALFTGWLARAELAEQEMINTNFQIGGVTRHLN